MRKLKYRRLSDLAKVIQISGISRPRGGEEVEGDAQEQAG